MPPKAVPKKRVALLRRRFRELVDWGFDGNLSLAARALEMPVSTVQQYYQDGPRRIGKKALTRIDELTGLGEWIAGDDDREIWREMEFTALRQQEGGPTYPVPRLVMWRVEKVVDEMVEHVDIDRDKVIDMFFSPILKGLEVGLFRGLPSPGSFFNPAFIGQAERLGSVANLKRLMGMEIGRAKQIHRLCEFWEGELRLVIKPNR